MNNVIWPRTFRRWLCGELDTEHAFIAVHFIGSGGISANFDILISELTPVEDVDGVVFLLSQSVLLLSDLRASYIQTILGENACATFREWSYCSGDLIPTT